MSRFEDNLWREIVRARGFELEKAEGPIGRRPAWRQIPVLAGGGLGLAGTAVAVVLVVGAAGSSAAFAVTPHSDGTVSVVIRRVQGIDGANRRLAQLGIRARAVRVSATCSGPSTAALPPVQIMSLLRARRADWVGADSKINAKIRPDQIPAGHTLVIPTVAAGTLVRLVHAGSVRGPVPSCLPAGVLARLRGAGATIQIVCPAAGPPPSGGQTNTSTGPVTEATTTNAPLTTTATNHTVTTTATNNTVTTTATNNTVTTTATNATTTANVTTESGATVATPPEPHEVSPGLHALIACARARAAAHRTDSRDRRQPGMTRQP